MASSSGVPSAFVPRARISSSVFDSAAALSSIFWIAPGISFTIRSRVNSVETRTMPGNALRYSSSATQ